MSWSMLKTRAFIREKYNVTRHEKWKKQLWVFVYMKYGKFWSVSLDTSNLISHPDFLKSDSILMIFFSQAPLELLLLLEENKRLKHDKERLSEQLSQSKGALRETLDRLHKKDVVLTSPMPSRRLFSSAVGLFIFTL